MVGKNSFRVSPSGPSLWIVILEFTSYVGRINKKMHFFKKLKNKKLGCLIKK
jgi:hypothetical protein